MGGYGFEKFDKVILVYIHVWFGVLEGEGEGQKVKYKQSSGRRLTRINVYS